MSPLPAAHVECPPSAGLSPRYKCDPFRFDQSPKNPGLCCGLKRIPDPYSIPGPNPVFTARILKVPVAMEARDTPCGSALLQLFPPTHPAHNKDAFSIAVPNAQDEQELALTHP